MRLGISRKFDLVLHLPLRYDDETQRLSDQRSAGGRRTCWSKAASSKRDVKYRPRRQLVVHIEDGSGVLTLRFLNFYPSQLKQLAPGTRVRAVRRDTRRVSSAPRWSIRATAWCARTRRCRKSLTPVYPTTAGLGQDDAAAADRARARATRSRGHAAAGACSRALQPARFQRSGALSAQPAARRRRRRRCRSARHPAWRRIKFDELLAQQLSMRLHYRTAQSRGRARAAAAAHAHARSCSKRCRSS